MHFSDQSELVRLSAFREPICKVCSQKFKSFKHLKEHVSLFHALKMCEQCLQNNKLFASEQVLYDEEAFRIHKITQHVQCDLCFTFHYDQRELLTHIKSQHFFCELCAVEKRTAYSNYNELEAHYRQAHYLCEVEMCKEEMHVVFMCYDDLKDHYRCNHPTLNIPPPVLGFKVREDDKPVMVFEDTSSKNYSVPKINEQNKDFEFPALAPAPVGKKTIDYSKISNSKIAPAGFPGLPIKDNTLEAKKKPKKKNKPEVPLIDKNISRLNNGHMTSNEFVE